MLGTLQDSRTLGTSLMYTYTLIYHAYMNESAYIDFDDGLTHIVTQSLTKQRTEPSALSKKEKAYLDGQTIKRQEKPNNDPKSEKVKTRKEIFDELKIRDTANRNIANVVYKTH